MSPENQDVESRSIIQTCGRGNRVGSNMRTTCQGTGSERRFWINSPGTGLLTKQPPYGKCIPEHAHNKTQDFTEML